MNKRGKTKLFVSVALVIILIAVIGVFAAAEAADSSSNDSSLGDSSSTSSNEISSEDEQIISDKVSSEKLPNKVAEYVSDFVKKRGIDAETINNISEVDFDSLPKEVNIENVNDANLAIYQVNYDETQTENISDEKNIYVVTYSVEKLREQGDLIIASDKREFLNFGSVGEMSNGFLETATGVEGSLEAGYVMMREGSITGISTSLDVVNASEGDANNENARIKIIVYKNGEAINFENSIDSSVSGLGKDYDIQSNGVVTFQPGDVISAYAVSSDGSASFKSVITMVEITTK